MKNETHFKIFPEMRLYKDFPWQIFAIGWLAIIKGVLWLALDSNLPDSTLILLGYRYIICMIPFIIFGIGVWNLRRWAIWGIIVLSVADLLFFLFLYPHSYNSLIVDGLSSIGFIGTAILIFVYGPVGNVLILLAIPTMLKHVGDTVL